MIILTIDSLLSWSYIYRKNINTKAGDKCQAVTCYIKNRQYWYCLLNEHCNKRLITTDCKTESMQSDRLLF
jgi:hypothetical protein